MKKSKRRRIRGRSAEVLFAILHCHGGPMKDRRERRAKDARRNASEMRTSAQEES